MVANGAIHGRHRGFVPRYLRLRGVDPKARSVQSEAALHRLQEAETSDAPFDQEFELAHRAIIPKGEMHCKGGTTRQGTIVPRRRTGSANLLSAAPPAEAPRLHA